MFLINMNVYQQDDSLKKLNYYSRCSPTSKHRRLYLHSPLLPLLNSQKQNYRQSSITKKQLLTPRKHQVSSFEFVMKPINVNLPHKNNIFIEENNNEHILIQESNQGEFKVELINNQEKDISWTAKQLLKEQQQIIINNKEKLLGKIISNVSNKNISWNKNDQIQRKNFQVEQNILGKESQDKDSFQPRMSRHFTFGSNFDPENEQPINSEPINYSSPVKRISSPVKQISSPLKQIDSSDASRQQSQQSSRCQSPNSQNYPLALEDRSTQRNKSSSQISNQKQQYKQLVKPFQIEINTEMLSEDNSYNILQVPQCVSPKFNLVQEVDLCVSIDSNQQNLKNQKINNYAFKKQMNKEIIEQKRSSLSQMKPFVYSISEIESILKILPQKLYLTYSEVHKRLCSSQNQIQSKILLQERSIKILRALRHLKKMGLQCQRYLSMNYSDDIDQAILLNQIIIRILIKKVCLKSE